MVYYQAVVPLQPGVSGLKNDRPFKIPKDAALLHVFNDLLLGVGFVGKGDDPD